MSDIPIVGQRPSVLDKPPAPYLVSICVPTHDIVPVKFALSLAEMSMTTGASLVADGIIDVTLSHYIGTYIAKARNELALNALKRDATHILWLDSDMTFPADLLIRLMNHNLPIVGVNYAKRRIPTEFVAMKTVAFNLEGGERSIRCPTLEDSTGLEEVEGMGFGCVLMQTEVFWNLEPPFFDQYYDRENKRWVGEDIHFAKLVKDAGFKMHIDHDLSKQVGHMGSLRFLNDHAADQWEESTSYDGYNELQRASDGGGELVRSE